MEITASHVAKNILFSSFQHKKSASKFEYLSPRSHFVNFTPEMPDFQIHKSDNL